MGGECGRLCIFCIIKTGLWQCTTTSEPQLLHVYVLVLLVIVSGVMLARKPKTMQAAHATRLSNLPASATLNHKPWQSNLCARITRRRKMVKISRPSMEQVCYLLHGLRFNTHGHRHIESRP